MTMMMNTDERTCSEWFRMPGDRCLPPILEEEKERMELTPSFLLLVGEGREGEYEITFGFSIVLFIMKITTLFGRGVHHEDHDHCHSDDHGHDEDAQH